MDSKRIVEIKGVKMEVDFREGTAVRVDHFRVGSKIKLLTKGYESFLVRPGIIIGFDEFKSLPTIKILVVQSGFTGGVEFVSFNEGLKDAELIAADDDEEVLAKRDDVITTLTRNVAAKKAELEAAEYALRQFNKYFGEMLGITTGTPERVATTAK